MNIFKRFTYVVVVALISLSCGLVARSKSKVTKPCSYTMTKDGVTLSVETVSEEECIRCFGTRINKRYVPLKITINNKGKQVLVLKSNDCSLRSLSHDEIVAYLNGEKLSWKPVALGVATVVIGVPLTVIGFGAVFVVCTFYSSLAVFCGGMALSTVPVAVGTAYTVKSAIEEKNKVKEAFVCPPLLTHDDPLIIEAGHQESRYVFVKKNRLKKCFSVTVWQKDGDNGIEFPVTLSAGCPA